MLEHIIKYNPIHSFNYFKDKEFDCLNVHLVKQANYYQAFSTSLKYDQGYKCVITQNYSFSFTIILFKEDNPIIDVFEFVFNERDLYFFSKSFIEFFYNYFLLK